MKRVILIIRGNHDREFDFTGKITKLRKALREVQKLERERQNMHLALKEGKIGVWSEFHSIDEPIYDKQNQVVYKHLGFDFGGSLVQFIYDEGEDVASSLETIVDAINKKEGEVWW